MSDLFRGAKALDQASELYSINSFKLVLQTSCTNFKKIYNHVKFSNTYFYCEVEVGVITFPLHC